MSTDVSEIWYFWYSCGENKTSSLTLFQISRIRNTHRVTPLKSLGIKFCLYSKLKNFDPMIQRNFIAPESPTHLFFHFKRIFSLNSKIRDVFD